MRYFMPPTSKSRHSYESIFVVFWALEDPKSAAFLVSFLNRERLNAGAYFDKIRVPSQVLKLGRRGLVILKNWIIFRAATVRLASCYD